jgi:choline-sulfatase
VGALKRVVTAPEREHLTSQYDGSIAYLDSQLGALIARLKQMEIYDEALVIITADHGEAFGDRNLVGHGLSVYQNQINVPLMIKYPRQRTARVIDRPASHIDLLPTILDVLDYPAPAHLQGQSLLRDTGPRRDLFSESFAQLKLIETHQRFNRVERALVVDNLKLVWSTVGKHELYDLSNDPDEERDLCGLDQATCAGLQAKLEEWRALIPRSQSPAVKLDRDGLGRLRNLGYIQ